MKKLPKAFLITKPRLKSCVTVHENPSAPYRAVVVDIMRDQPDLIAVTNLRDRTTAQVPWGFCCHAKM